MAVNPERAGTIGVDELRTLETTVLKTLCLTINTAGSELKYKILDSLSDDDFYFPVFRAVFHTLAEMHLRGDYVISANLEEELQKTAENEIPTGFAIEQFFDGTLPSLTDLSAWVGRLKERSRSGIIPSVQPPPREPAPVPPRADTTVVKSVAEVKRKIAEEQRKSNPSVPPERATPPASPLSASSPNVKSSPRLALEKSAPVSAPPPSGRISSVAPVSPISSISSVARVKPPPTPPPREKSSPAVTPPASPVPRPRQKAVLSSEGDDWSSYLEDLAKKQGNRFDTGFSRLDAELGGLMAGLFVLVDEDRNRITSFLKQVTDQVAAATSMRCLFLACDSAKAELRLRTIARLAEVSVEDLEKGRLKKDSAEWGRVDGAGRGAADWLRRVFVYEVEDLIELPLMRELTKKLLEASADGGCLVVLDALEKVSNRGETTSSLVSQLKALAESLDVLIVAASTDPTLLASKDADYAAVFRQSPQGAVELEILRSGRESSTLARFKYEPELCRFSEL
jgi:DnaB-like helicase C terminal domain